MKNFVVFCGHCSADMGRHPDFPSARKAVIEHYLARHCGDVPAQPTEAGKLQLAHEALSRGREGTA